MRPTKAFKTLTNVDHQLLAALREAGDWQTRQQIAERIGQTPLTQYALLRLQILTRQGLAETRRVSQKRGKRHYEYRAVIDPENRAKG